jgi:signal transduction histidine kinase
VVIALVVVAGVVSASTISFVQQSARLQEEHTTQVRLSLNRLASLTALALREPLWQFVPEQADSILEAAFTDPELVSMEVLDQKGSPFASRERVFARPDLIESVTVNIERDRVNVGKLHIQMSTAGFVDKVQAARLQFFLGTVQTCIVALVLIVVLLHWRLARPLLALVSASERIARGELDVPIRKAFNDEVGTLADSLEATRRALLNLVAELESRNQALTDANETLEQRVIERTESLKQALDTLERARDEIIQTEKLASLGRVVAGVAHELNTPIGSAMTVTSAMDLDLQQIKLEMDAGTLKRSALVSLIDRMSQAASLAMRNLDRAANLIADFKQVAVDQTSDLRRSFDLAEVTSEVVNMLQPALRRSNCTVTLELQPDVKCDGYPGRYGQVLTNLIMNAATHAFEADKPGTVMVTVSAINDQMAQLLVSDDGVGMTSDVSSRVFDPFFTTKMGRGGTGLGMNIVHGIVTRVMGGSVQVQSAPGKGTTVRAVFKRLVE